jgi:hypothetical protein
MTIPQAVWPDRKAWLQKQLLFSSLPFKMAAENTQRFCAIDGLKMDGVTRHSDCRRDDRRPDPSGKKARARHNRALEIIRRGDVMKCCRCEYNAVSNSAPVKANIRPVISYRWH